MLEAVNKEISPNTNEALYVLRRLGVDGSKMNGPPGYQVGIGEGI